MGPILYVLPRPNKCNSTEPKIFKYSEMQLGLEQILFWQTQKLCDIPRIYFKYYFEYNGIVKSQHL